MRTGLPAVHLRETPSTIRDDRFTRCSFPAATTHAPLWLWQEVQALPWSTEIVALTCGTQNCLRPHSSVLKRPRQACCATPVQDQKCWNTAAFEQSQFIDHTGYEGYYGYYVLNLKYL